MEVFAIFATQNIQVASHAHQRFAKLAHQVTLFKLDHVMYVTQDSLNVQFAIKSVALHV